MTQAELDALVALRDKLMAQYGAGSDANMASVITYLTVVIISCKLWRRATNGG